MTRWPQVQLRHVARLAYGDSLASDDRVAGDVAVYGSNGPVGTHDSANTSSPVLIVGRKGSYGKIHYSGRSVFAIDTTYFIDSTTSHHDLRWLYYALSTLRLDSMSQDVGVPGLSRESAYAERVPLPPAMGQRAIAHYLDTETARIDALTAKKRRMIELAAERRRSLIEYELGRGFTAAEYITAEVPGDQVVRLKHLLSGTIAGGTPDSSNAKYWSEDGDGMPWLAIGDMVEGGVTMSTNRRVSSEGLAVARLRPGPPGTLLFAMYASMGKVSTTAMEAIWNQAIIGLVPRPASSDAGFLGLWLEVLRPHLGLLTRSTTQDNLNAEQVGNLPVPRLDLAAQTMATQRLSVQLALVDEIAAVLAGQLVLLAEHRQALITAAVTGELGVRGVAA